MKEPSEMSKDRTERQELARPIEPVIPPSQPSHSRYSYGYDYDGEAEQGSGYSRLHDYLRSARKRLWLILGIMVVITTLAAFYMARQPDVYEAKAHIQVDLEVSNPVLGSVKSNAFILNAPSQDPGYFNTQIANPFEREPPRSRRQNTGPGT